MKRSVSLSLEPLEGRELLSGAHAARAAEAHARAHARPDAAAPAPLVFSGTLTVNNSKSVMGQNGDYGYTVSVPVSGTLSGVGPVTGLWYESTDQTGNYIGPDTITLHGSKGSFTVAFSNAEPGPAHRTSSGVYYQHSQKSDGGTGAYAGAKESGTIDLNENAKHSEVTSITLNGS